MVDHFGDAGHRRCYNGQAARQRLHNGDGLAITVTVGANNARQYVQVGGPEALKDLKIGERAQEVDNVVKLPLLDKLF